jgi:hypothetical protein
MYLVVDCSGQQMFTLTVYFPERQNRCYLVAYLFDPAVPDENILCFATCLR